MNAAAGRLAGAVLGSVVLVGLSTGATLTLLAPRFLLIDPDVAQASMTSGFAIGGVGLIVICMSAWVRLRRLRFTLRAISLGSKTVEPEELAALDRVPGSITATTVVISVLATLVAAIPPFRPKGMAVESAVVLALLTITLCATAALPLYVLVRRRVALAMGIAPEDAVREMIERAVVPGRTDRRILQRVTLAVVTPTAMVAFGIAILAHAHVRAFEARGRLASAIAIAQAALEPVPGAVPTAGESDAASAALPHGFRVQLHEQSTPFRVDRKDGGRLAVRVPLDLGHATVSFEETTLPALAVSSIAAGILASLLAAALGGYVGRKLLDDLVQATLQVQLLGTEAVLRGSTQIARPARFVVVAHLGEAVNSLAARFRVFASAQEKAIEAREAARRMRGLLFASVSHDLKGSLNAILGFADLVDESGLQAGQRESLDVVKHRSRELLGLVQTILDGARVEAGQIVLERKNVRLAELIEEAAECATQGVPGSPVTVSCELAPDAPWMVHADPARLVDAFTGLLRHGLRTSTEGVIVVRAASAPTGAEVLVDVRVPTRAVPAAKLTRLLMPDGESTMPRSAGGLALGLSLARSLVVLQSGNVRAFDTEDGVVLRVSLPLVADGA